MPYPDDNGLVNGDTAASLTTGPTLATTATATSHVAGNPYSITASGAVDGGATISLWRLTLTVTTAPLTITAMSKRSFAATAKATAA